MGWIRALVGVPVIAAICRGLLPMRARNPLRFRFANGVAGGRIVGRRRVNGPPRGTGVSGSSTIGTVAISAVAFLARLAPFGSPGSTQPKEADMASSTQQVTVVEAVA